MLFASSIISTLDSLNSASTMNLSDPYLILRPRSLTGEFPKDLLPYFETIRHASAWVALGFSVKLDSYGFPTRESSGAYRFSLARENDPLIAEAIRTGKKAVNHPLAVFEYVLAGSSLSEFVELPEDVKAYCQGNLLRVNGNSREALPLLEKAISLNPDEVRYREIYYPLRLAMGDLSSIEDELTCFENDIDSIIHTGRFEQWIKTLIAASEYRRAGQVLEKVDAAISRLADGKAKPRFYGPQRPEWYTHKRTQFIKKAEKYLSRIQTLETKAARTATPKSKKPPATPENPQKGGMPRRGTEVAELLYTFTQCCFIGEQSEEPLDLTAEAYVYEMLISGPLSVVDVQRLPIKYRQLLREILTQYIMFLKMNRDLPFPTDFLKDSSKEQLGLPLLQYINEHRWPFPQLLPKKQ